MRRKGTKLHSLLHSADLVEEHLRIQLAPLGLRPRQARVLNALARIGPCSQSVLAREFDITQASMSTMTDRLVAAGYILRAPDINERRTNALSLTESGENMLKDVRSAWSAVDRIIEDAIGFQEAKALAEMTTKLRIALGGAIPGKNLVANARKQVVKKTNP